MAAITPAINAPVSLAAPAVEAELDGAVVLAEVPAAAPAADFELVVLGLEPFVVLAVEPPLVFDEAPPLVPDVAPAPAAVPVEAVLPVNVTLDPRPPALALSLALALALLALALALLALTLSCLDAVAMIPSALTICVASGPYALYVCRYFFTSVGRAKNQLGECPAANSLSNEAA